MIYTGNHTSQQNLFFQIKIHTMKYRIWDVDIKKYKYIDLCDLQKTIDVLDYFRGNYSNEYFVGTDYLQRYTYFKDMQWNEIYEGDTVSAVMKNTEAEWIGEIILENGAFMLQDRWLNHFRDFNIIKHKHN